MFYLLLCKCFDKLLKQDDKGDVSTETMGPAQAGLLLAETCTPSRLCVLGLRIGSADRLGPWFDALLVQWCLEKYADHIALPVVFSLPVEVSVSAGCIGGSLDADHMACECVRNSDHVIFWILAESLCV
ncbi:hypothetical protein V6N13_008763 [Hibiscus sabdariffa]